MDMVAQAQKQKAFLTMVFGGPNNYSGRDMRAAHAHLGLTEEHFNAVVENLAATLTELGVSDDDIAEVAELAAPMDREFGAAALYQCPAVAAAQLCYAGGFT